MIRFQIQTNHAGEPQLCRIVSGRGDAANCREIIATGDELQEILTLLTNNERNDMKVTIIKPVRCCRCRNLHGENDRVRKKRRDGWFQSICPRCGGIDYHPVNADGNNCKSGDKQAETLVKEAR